MTVSPTARFDHQCNMSKGPNIGAMGCHHHAESGYRTHGRHGSEPAFIRIFFYLNGFALEDGNLKTCAPPSSAPSHPICGCALSLAWHSICDV